MITKTGPRSQCVFHQERWPKLKQAWFVYLLECAKGKIYCGITTDLDARFRKHVSGKGAKFTRANPPSHIIASLPCLSRSEASKLEWKVKSLSPAKKRALASQWSTVKDLVTREAQAE